MLKLRVLDKSSVQAVREWFNQGQKWRSKTVDFDQILELFGNDCASFAEIAERVDLTKERIRQLYKKYFTPLFPNRPCGRARQKMCVLKTNAQRAQDFSNAPTKLRRIAEIAKARGYPVKKVVRFKHGNRVSAFSTTTMLINGKICTIHYLRSVFSPSPRSDLTYTHFRVRHTRVEKHDFVIVIRQACATEQIFVIPIKTLLENWGCGWFYIREQKTSLYPNRHLRIDFWQYLDAWHLLAG